MSEEADTSDAPDATSGSLIVRRDGIVVTAEKRACRILSAPDPASLAGRDWTSLIAPEDGDALMAARHALLKGQPWEGVLRYRYAHDAVTQFTTITPAEGSDLAVVVLGPTAPRLRTPRRALTDDEALRAQVAAQDALADGGEAPVAARAVLQALRVAVPFEWATALRFEPPRTTRVVAVYPAAMAGIYRDATWENTRAEALLAAIGEPSLDGVLTRETDATAPLSRLPAFGLTSRLLIPLFSRSEVVGALLVYRAGHAAFDALDGLHAERIVRRLGDVVRAGPHVSTTAHPAVAQHEEHIPSAPAADTQRHEEHIASAPAADTHGAPSAAIPDPSLRSLGELVAGVAHELNNPLTAILGYAQILPTLEADERSHALQTIEAEAQRAARIVRNLLAFARQRPGDRRDVDIETVLRRVIDLRRYSLEVDNVRVVTRFGHVPAIRVDEGQLEQAFLNLLNNAHQALKDGGELVISTWTRDGHLCVSFADDGAGIPEPLRHRVFEPFFTTREVGHGAGMGLAMVYGVITAHEGRTWVEPSPSGGASFVIELPLSEEAAPDDAPEQLHPAGDAEATSPDVQAAGRVLVVDDEAPVRSLTQAILGGAGYEVMTAATGAEALRLLSRGGFEVVITDLRMPGMSGADLYHEIRERWPELAEHVLFVTGDIEGDSGSRPLAQDEVHYLEKPFTTQQLLQSVRRVVSA